MGHLARQLALAVLGGRVGAAAEQQLDQTAFVGGRHVSHGDGQVQRRVAGARPRAQHRRHQRRAPASAGGGPPASGRRPGELHQQPDEVDVSLLDGVMQRRLVALAVLRATTRPTRR